MIPAITPHGKLLSTGVCNYIVLGLYAPSRRGKPRPTRNDPPGSPRLCLATVQRQPKADAYRRDDALTADAAEAYHRDQVETFKAADADLVTALSFSSSQEAIGIVRASDSVGLPAAVSFMLEKDRRLLSGETLPQAIESVDAATGGSAAYYLVNCAHPLDIAPAGAQEDWVTRVRGLRANASDHTTTVS